MLEVMVTAGIFALLASLILADFRNGGRNDRLKAAADEMASRIKQAQGMAYANTKQMICNDNLVCLSGSSCDASYPTNCLNQYVSRYGVAFVLDGANNKYMIGADYANFGTYVDAEAIPKGIVTLPTGYIINSVTPAIVAPNYNLVYIYDAANASPFVTCSSNCTTTIVIKDTVTNLTKSVIVQKQTGAVYVQ